MLDYLMHMEVRFNAKQDETLDELKQVKQSLKGVEAENKQLRSDVNRLTDIVSSQQRYLEWLDAQERACNLIVRGVPETEPLGTAGSDNEKLDLIFRTIECDGIAAGFSCKRLGNPRDDGQSRLLLAVLPNSEARNEAFKHRLKLERSGGIFKNIVIKKDQHPSIKREWGRLYQIFESTKRNPGCNVIFDKKKRQIFLEDQLIDC